MDRELNLPLTGREAALVQYALDDLKGKLEVYDNLMNSKGMSRIRNTDDLKQNREDIETVKDLIARVSKMGTGVRI
jgi:hypothetical protein